jgi:hypothetical protein
MRKFWFALLLLPGLIFIFGRFSEIEAIFMTLQ